jgi:hypothetical protein
LLIAAAASAAAAPLSAERSKAVPPVAEERSLQGLQEEMAAIKRETAALEEELLFGPASASRARIVLRDEAAPHFALVGVEADIDGLNQPAAPAGEPGAAGTPPPLLLDAPLGPGPHLLRLKLTYQGRTASLGSVFSYYEGYRFIVRASCPFEVLSGETTQVIATAFDRGGKRDWPQRLAVDFVSGPLREGNVRP